MRGQRVVSVSVVVAACLGATGTALALEQGAAAAALTVSTATLAPARVVTASATCPGNKAGDILVQWTASASPFVTGYTIARSVNGRAAATVATVTGATTSYDDTAVTGSSTYVYSVTATYRSWTSTVASAPPVTTSKHC